MTERDFQSDVIDRLARIETHLEGQADAREDHEDRLRTVEKRQWYLAGAAALLVPVLGKLGLHIPETW